MSQTPKSAPKVILTAILYFYMLNIMWQDIFFQLLGLHSTQEPQISVKNSNLCMKNQDLHKNLNYSDLSKNMFLESKYIVNQSVLSISNCWTMEKKYQKNFFLSAENKLFFSRKFLFFAFLVVFDPLFGVITLPDQKKYQFLYRKKFGWSFGSVGSRLEKFKIYLIFDPLLPYNSYLGRLMAEMGRVTAEPILPQTHTI